MCKSGAMMKKVVELLSKDKRIKLVLKFKNRKIGPLVFATSAAFAQGFLI